MVEELDCRKGDKEANGESLGKSETKPWSRKLMYWA